MTTSASGVQYFQLTTPPPPPPQKMFWIGCFLETSWAEVSLSVHVGKGQGEAGLGWAGKCKSGRRMVVGGISSTNECRFAFLRRTPVHQVLYKFSYIHFLSLLSISCIYHNIVHLEPLLYHEQCNIVSIYGIPCMQSNCLSGTPNNHSTLSHLGSPCSRCRNLNLILLSFLLKILSKTRRVEREGWNEFSLRSLSLFISSVTYALGVLAIFLQIEVLHDNTLFDTREHQIQSVPIPKRYKDQFYWHTLKLWILLKSEVVDIQFQYQFSREISVLTINCVRMARIVIYL